MRHIIIILFTYLILSPKASEAQVDDFKRTNIYYFLDTAAVPIKDRIFEIDNNGSTIYYNILCMCYPWQTNIRFFSTRVSKTRPLALDEFNKIKTASILDLINIGIQFGKELIVKYNFFIIEPVGKEMRITEVTLAYPRKPKTHSTIIEVKPLKN
ncbi:hypothetical protein [Pedobacter gandavensis]|uniref:hypothetical protein n=1 Tax=Pedobacter gandavensis TaxID=2679963 RepID=UPI00292D0797|nr:hypothetical protein [Pedobacter gandavensis]